jgi:hypothetical protein
MKPAPVLAIASCLATIASTAAGEILCSRTAHLDPLPPYEGPIQLKLLRGPDRAKAERYLGGEHIRSAAQGFENALRSKPDSHRYIVRAASFAGIENNYQPQLREGKLTFVTGALGSSADVVEDFFVIATPAPITSYQCRVSNPG